MSHVTTYTCVRVEITVGLPVVRIPIQILCALEMIIAQAIILTLVVT